MLTTTSFPKPISYPIEKFGKDIRIIEANAVNNRPLGTGLDGTNGLDKFYPFYTQGADTTKKTTDIQNRASTTAFATFTSGILRTYAKVHVYIEISASAVDNFESIIGHWDNNTQEVHFTFDKYWTARSGGGYYAAFNVAISSPQRINGKDANDWAVTVSDHSLRNFQIKRALLWFE